MMNPCVKVCGFMIVVGVLAIEEKDKVFAKADMYVVRAGVKEKGRNGGLWKEV